MLPDPLSLAALAVAPFLGALIGLERELRGHAAGLHADALVSLGAAIYVVGAVLVGDATAPARVAGQVVTGVGFLCAGVILHQGANVKGINTAATVWCASGVGVLAGLGLIGWAVLATALVVSANVLLHLCSHALKEREARREG